MFRKDGAAVVIDRRVSWCFPSPLPVEVASWSDLVSGRGGVVVPDDGRGIVA